LKSSAREQRTKTRMEKREIIKKIKLKPKTIIEIEIPN
jgi:hypothetical protein